MGRNDNGRLAGRVARIKSENGFGFIQGDDRVDRFFHRSALIAVEFEDLREGQRVTFEHEDGTKGARAVNVRTE